MAESLVKMYLDTSGGFSRNKEIQPEDLTKIPDMIRNKIADRMTGYGDELNELIIDGYVKAIRVRPREEGAHLLDRLRQALTKTVNSPQREVWLGVFELSVIDRLTRNEGPGTLQHGWFENLEDGRGDERAFGSEEYQFVYKDRAIKLAEEAADQFKMNPTKRAKFIDDVTTRFSGRHGEGIMVKLDEPLFYELPQYGKDEAAGTSGRGKAINVLGTSSHPGYPALDVLSKVAKTAGPRMKELAHLAIQDVAKAL